MFAADFALAWSFGIAFQYFSIVPMREDVGKLEAVWAAPGAAGSLIARLFFVGIALSYNPAMAGVEKVMVSMPGELLRRIDRAADRRGTSRSAFLQEAARRELGWPDPDQIETALERGQAALANAGSFESAKLIREERDSRDARDRRR